MLVAVLNQHLWGMVRRIQRHKRKTLIFCCSSIIFNLNYFKLKWKSSYKYVYRKFDRKHLVLSEGLTSQDFISFLGWEICLPKAQSRMFKISTVNCWKLYNSVRNKRRKHLLCRYMGTITGISDLDAVRWKNSQWRNLQVDIKASINQSIDLECLPLVVIITSVITLLCLIGWLGRINCWGTA